MPGITKVGEAGIAGGNSGSPVTITYSSTAGNTLVLSGHLFDNNNGAFVAPTSITDSTNGQNVWQVSTNSAQSALTVQDPPLCSLTDPSDGSTAHMADWVAWCVSAQAVTSVTFAWEGGVSTWRRVVLSEYAGVVQFDNSWAGGSTSGASSVNAGPLQINVPGELVVGVVDFGSGGTEALPNGWTNFTTAGYTDNGYIIGPATGAYSPVFTNTLSESWVGALAVFSPVVLGSGYVLPEFIFSYVSGTGKLSDSKNPTTVNNLASTSVVNDILSEVIGVDYSELY